MSKHVCSAVISAHTVSLLTQSEIASADAKHYRNAIKRTLSPYILLLKGYPSCLAILSKSCSHKVLTKLYVKTYFVNDVSLHHFYTQIAYLASASELIDALCLQVEDNSMW